jgi:hypothetical protein
MTGRIVSALTLVVLVLAARNCPQILNTVIRTVAVDVVNFRRDVTVVHQEYQCVFGVILPANTHATIARAVNRPCCITNLSPTACRAMV